MRILLHILVILIVTMPCLSQTNNTCQVPTISVSAMGSASGTPDTATFSVEIATTAISTIQASQTTNRKISQVLQVLSNNNILSQNIQTSSLTISPQYNYSGSYPYPITGQQATTSVNVKVNNIDPNGTAVGTLYDQLSGIDGVTITQLAFDISNKTSLQTKARALAYQSAVAKAGQYASYAGYQLGKPQSID